MKPRVTAQLHSSSARSSKILKDHTQFETGVEVEGVGRLVLDVDSAGSPIDTDHERSLKHLRVALQGHHQALEELESALLEFEQSISGEATLRPEQEEQRPGVQLLSIPQLCQELGMGKSWIYRRLRSGEIPSIRLGRTIKVRRDELEEYLQRHHYPPRQEAQEE
jgi:excisionase family DNA binding protein